VLPYIPDFANWTTNFRLENHKKGAPQHPAANDRPCPEFSPHLKSHITAPFSFVLFVWQGDEKGFSGGKTPENC